VIPFDPNDERDKEIADFVTRSNENSGVAHAIRTFAL